MSWVSGVYLAMCLACRRASFLFLNKGHGLLKSQADRLLYECLLLLFSLQWGLESQCVHMSIHGHEFRGYNLEPWIYQPSVHLTRAQLNVLEGWWPESAAMGRLSVLVKFGAEHSTKSSLLDHSWKTRIFYKNKQACCFVLGPSLTLSGKVTAPIWLLNMILWSYISIPEKNTSSQVWFEHSLGIKWHLCWIRHGSQQGVCLPHCFGSIYVHVIPTVKQKWSVQN